MIKIHKPEWAQGERAATKVLREIEHIESHPEQFIKILGTEDINKTLKDSNNWNFELYEEKFNLVFKRECIKKELGKESKNGILTSKELAQLYMTFLAEEIAFEKVANPITDSQEYDLLTNYLRGKNPRKENMLNCAKTIVTISLPQNIKNIKLEKFIEFRKDSGIKELRQIFNQSISKFYESLEEDFAPDQYIHSLKTISTELIKEIGLFFGGVASSTLGAIILIANPTNIEAVKQIIEGTILIVSGVTAINKAWSDGQEKRHVRKFLSKIKQIR